MRYLEDCYRAQAPTGVVASTMELPHHSRYPTVSEQSLLEYLIMRLKLAVATFALLSLPVGSAMADAGFWRDVISSGATTGSTYLTFKDHKLIVAAQDDAGSFVASDGGIRGPFLEAAIQQVRSENPGLNASDMDLANAILAKNLVAENQ
ncbi:Ribonucleotide reductase, alpha subunit [Pseudomonas savastanoi pv. glycinea]|nr:Ribonucleotide reductase, alpha subunit [Pseudomonas savastanoi pv. glycinea]